jgi:hypothetical protein
MGGGDSGSSSEQAVVTPTADMVAQENINSQLWNYYQSSYKPVVDKYVAKTADPETQDEEGRKIAGQINAEAVKNIKPGDASSNPVVNEKRLNTLATTETGAQMQGQGAARSRKLNELKNVIDIGQGQETTAGAGITELAGQSISAEISNIDLQQQTDAAIENAYGSMAGATAAGLMKAGNSQTPKTRQINPNTTNTIGNFLTDPVMSYDG